MYCVGGAVDGFRGGGVLGRIKSCMLLCGVCGVISGLVVGEGSGFCLWTWTWLLFVYRVPGTEFVIVMGLGFVDGSFLGVDSLPNSSGLMSNCACALSVICGCKYSCGNLGSCWKFSFLMSLRSTILWLGL